MGPSWDMLGFWSEWLVGVFVFLMVDVMVGWSRPGRKKDGKRKVLWRWSEVLLKSLFTGHVNCWGVYLAFVYIIYIYIYIYMYHTWNSKANQFVRWMEMVKQAWTRYKDLVQHPIENHIYFNGWPSSSRQIVFFFFVVVGLDLNDWLMFLF